MNPQEYKKMPERLQKIAAMRNLGMTFSEIGKEFNVSTERARQLYKKYLAIVDFNERLSNLLASDSLLKALYFAQKELGKSEVLITRTYNCIHRSGFDADKLLNGDYSDEELLSIKNLGVDSLELIHKAIDISKNSKESEE